MNLLKNNQILYRLGLDLGTSSIGVAIYKMDLTGKIISLEHLDSYIFGEPVAAKEMVTLNTARRSARLIRRQVDRKAARLRKIGYIAKSLGVERSDLIEDKQDVVELRARAVNEKISLPQLVKVFCHIIKNRGYRGAISERIVGKKLKQTEELLGKDKTLGQLLWEEKQKVSKGQPWRKIEEDGTFIYRHAVEDEFERIWSEQVKHHPRLSAMYDVWGENMFPDYPGQRQISLHDAFRSAMFYQHPIKWDLETVGICDLFPEERRAAQAQVAYQHYRMAKEIDNLRIREEGSKTSYPLTLAQQSQLFEFMEARTDLCAKEDGVISFGEIYNFLGLPKNVSFTADRGSKKGLKANLTLWAFEKAGLLNLWAELSDKEQELVIEFLSNITNLSDLEENDPSYIANKFVELTQNITASAEERKNGAQFVVLNKARLSKLDLESGRCSYSVRGLRFLTEEIKQGNLQNSNEEEYVKSLAAKNKVFRGKMRTVAAIKAQKGCENDPVIGRALREFHRVMTYIVHRYGNPQEIVVELSRDLKNSLSRRKFLEDQNKNQAEERKKAANELKQHNVLATPRNIEKYLLWEQQKHTCPYSGKSISFSQAFNEKETQVDHIVPRCGEIPGANVFANKVLAFTKENKEKSNRLPYEWKFRKDIDDYNAFMIEKKAKKKKGEESVSSFGSASPLINFIQHLWSLHYKEKKGYYNKRKHAWTPTQKGAQILLKINNLLSTPASLNADFAERQNHETAWINKIVLDWCKDICPKVTPSFGALTSYLREQLRFGDILPRIRLAEGKSLFDKDDKELEVDKGTWEELFASPFISYNESKILKKEFDAYCESLPLADRPLLPSDKKRKFAKYCMELRKKNNFYKRCDHRHHAVDAAVIGLCNLSVVHQASEHHRKYGTLYKIKAVNAYGVRIPSKDIAGFTIDNIPVWLRMKKEVEKRLINYVVWHKPDHYPSGKFFDETAYNVRKKDGVERFVRRAELGSFLKKTEKETLKNLEQLLFADTIKDVIIAQFKERLAQGLAQEEALCGKKDDLNDGIYYRGNKVKKVKYMYKEKYLMSYAEGIDRQVKHYSKDDIEHKKYYQSAGYACMDFEEKTGKRLDSGLIPRWKYKEQQHIPCGVIRVFLGDILFDKINKNFYIVQQFSAAGGLKCILTTEVKKKDSKLKAVSALTNYVLVANRKDIAKLKRE